MLFTNFFGWGPPHVYSRNATGSSGSGWGGVGKRGEEPSPMSVGQEARSGSGSSMSSGLRPEAGFGAWPMAGRGQPPMPLFSSLTAASEV